MSTEIRCENLSKRINRIIGSVPLNGKGYFLAVAHLINSSALPDKLFHPRHQPIILYISGCLVNHKIMNYFSFNYQTKVPTLHMDA